ncbi:hypothetical protein ACFSKU_03075 [Pontibacter silvestris]|uniref:YcxB-like protein domain-containing protein n=1 Tax=Pontibacter silvestris TaxID=2305183 RepID=A0ABW4WUK9_9BACT|nr:hypothetical protein [Pontibacter silvestris]MCC9138119.1 hypothetical protein [Pontibacter silvestris]
MQETSFQLSPGAYAVKAKTECLFMLFALCSVAVHINLLYRLLALNDYKSTFLIVYSLNLIPLAYFLVTIWLDKKPKCRRHLTLSTTGARYRTKFMTKEHEFDWDEVDVIHLEHFRVLFVLKNEEEHDVSLERVQNNEELSLIKEQIRERALMKGIDLD